MSSIEYSFDSPRHKIADGLRSLCRHTGLSPEFVVELSSENRLAELFDVDTRELKTRVELRSLQGAKRISGRDAVAAMMHRRPTVDGPAPHGRTALARLRAKKAAWV